jgi:hypothetical protein
VGLGVVDQHAAYRSLGRGEEVAALAPRPVAAAGPLRPGFGNQSGGLKGVPGAFAV